MYHGFPIGSGYEHPALQRYGYIDLPDSSPLYPFGHGLTYTSFELEINRSGLRDNLLCISAQVANRGARHGTAVVQLYPRDEMGSVVRPIRQLVDFARVSVAPDAAETVEFAVPLERLAYTWRDGRRGVEAGDVTLLLGLSSGDIRATATLDVPELILD